MKHFEKILKNNFKSYTIISSENSLSGLIIIETPMGERKITIPNDRLQGGMFYMETKTDGLSKVLDELRAITEESKEYLFKQWMKN